MEKESNASVLAQEKEQLNELSEKFAAVHKQLENMKNSTGPEYFVWWISFHINVVLTFFFFVAKRRWINETKGKIGYFGISVGIRKTRKTKFWIAIERFKWTKFVIWISNRYLTVFVLPLLSVFFLFNVINSSIEWWRVKNDKRKYAT
jgi:hypothetical protein